MRSKDLSMQVKQTIVRLQKQNKSIREIAGTLGVAKSTVWYILRKNKCTGELSNIKRPGHPWRTTVLDDRRILSMVKKNPFLNIQPREEHSPGGRCVTVKVYNQEKTIESKYRCSPQGANKARLDFAKKHLKKPDHLWKSILWTPEIKINLYQNDRKKKVWRRLGTAHGPKHTSSSVKHVGSVRWHERAWLPVILGYWCLFYTALHSTNVRWPKTYSKSNPGVFEGKKVEFCNSL